MWGGGSGCQGWPEGAKEKDVLRWFRRTYGSVLELRGTTAGLWGSTADRKLDIGFVDDLNADMDSKCHWKQILISGELKSNPSVDRASKAWLDLERYAREVLAA